MLDIRAERKSWNLKPAFGAVGSGRYEALGGEQSKCACPGKVSSKVESQIPVPVKGGQKGNENTLSQGSVRIVALFLVAIVQRGNVADRINLPDWTLSPFESCPEAAKIVILAGVFV
ncbi:uncharacterized protein MCYG_06283 [Microsporum canis CBS 113480]|uniref:Uncharacterized protein n=1 Tax=Arthroderma otae (strain ATCC MYA-4605 / CBS 113480) TaxID=554155 RepID=C5FU80_ARTOC|nr:uncharacterized protein MCYG_06283 [Microsporum canis CBS 113480]EEQ33464.1 predicted protein [Microsporum canis CBS 113480]